jgi:hypothetical protein
MPIAVQRARANGAVCLRMAEDASAVLARMQAMMNGAYTPAPAAYAPPRNANIRKYENAWTALQPVPLTTTPLRAVSAINFPLASRSVAAPQAWNSSNPSPA